jgi:hypothetical protein
MGGAGWLPLPLFDSAKLAGGERSGRSGLAPPQSCYWSDLYSSYPRRPHDVSAAPWVSLSSK